MFGFGEMIKGLKANPKTIVFTERAPAVRYLPQAAAHRQGAGDS